MDSVSFHRLAENELRDAAEFYENERPGLGVSFLGAVERSIAAILTNPEAGAPVLGSVRRRLVQRFPYGVLYRVRPEGVRILAVMNLRRRPYYWVGRL